MDAIAAATLAFAAIGAVGTIHGIADAVRRRRADRRHDMEALEANWSLHARAGWIEEHVVLSLTCNDVVGSPVRLISLEVLKPERAQICEGRLVHGEGPPLVVPADDHWGAKLDLDRDLYGSIVWGEGQERAAQWVITHLIARFPLPPGSPRGRYRLAVVVEDRSAARRRRRIVVASQEVDLPTGVSGNDREG